MRPRLRYFLNLTLAAAIPLMLSAIGLFIFLSYEQAQFYLHPVRKNSDGNLLTQAGIQYQDVELMTSDGLTLSAWYTPPKNGTVILLAHGYGDCRSGITVFYELFASRGYGVLAWDFRAHGTSEGEFTSLGYYEVQDVKAALDYARAQPGVRNVAGWRGSMGAVTMIRAAAAYPEIEAVIADSAFSNLDEEFEQLTPFTLLSPLSRLFAEYETGVQMSAVNPIQDVARISPRPIFIIQSLVDTAIPIDSAQRMYDAAGAPRELWTEDDPPHLNMYAYYKVRYANRVMKFLDTYLK